MQGFLPFIDKDLEQVITSHLPTSSFQSGLSPHSTTSSPARFPTGINLTDRYPQSHVPSMVLCAWDLKVSTMKICAPKACNYSRKVKKNIHTMNKFDGMLQVEES